MIALFIFSYGLENMFSASTDFTIPIFAACFAFAFASILKHGNLSFKVEDIIVFAFIIYTLIFSIIDNNANQDLRYLFTLILGAFVPFYLGRIIMDAEAVNVLLKSIFACGWMVVGYLYYANITSPVKYRSLFGSAHHIGLSELIAFFTLSCVLLMIRNRKYLIPCIIGIFSSLYAILFILAARGALLSAVLTVICIILIDPGIKKAVKFRVFILSTGMVIFFLLYINVINPEITAIYPGLSRFTLLSFASDTSIYGSSEYFGRLDYYRMSFTAFSNNPLFGISPGIIYSHNIFLEFASSFGTIGLGLLLLFIGLLVWKVTHIKLDRNALSIICFLLFPFLYYQTSFNIDAYKSLFIFAGMLVSIDLGRFSRFADKVDSY